MNEWTDEQIRKWVKHECWLYRKEHPGGRGLFLTKENLKAGSPPLERIAEAMTFLIDKEEVEGEIGGGFKPEESGNIYYIKGLKLTAKAIEQIEKQARSQS